MRTQPREGERVIYSSESRAEKEVWEELNHLWGNRREQRTSGDKELAKGQGCIPITVTSRLLTCTALNRSLRTCSGLEGKITSDVFSLSREAARLTLLLQQQL